MPLRLILLLALLLAATTGCVAPDDEPSSQTASQTEHRLRVAATSRELTLDYEVRLQGVGSDDIGAIDVVGPRGTIAIDGRTVPVVAYERQGFEGYTLYQMLAVENDRITVVWAYCEYDDLAAFYFESTDGTRMQTEWAEGTCYETPGTTTARVDLPALDMPIPRLLDDYTISGPQIALDGDEPGRIVLSGTSQILYPFEEVDCTDDCGPNGWREIHTLIWEPTSSALSFGILYLYDDQPHVGLQYALQLPTLDDPGGGQLLQASWDRD